MSSEMHSPLATRRAGILLHPTSLPGPGENGELGPEAYRFVDFLAAAGQKVWQMLPLGPTHGDYSPYQALSTCAGNPELISLQLLQEWGLLHGDLHELQNKLGKAKLLIEVWNNFQQHADEGLMHEWQQFQTEHAFWLEDYASYRVLKGLYQERGWYDWPAPLRDRDADAMADLKRLHADRLDEVAFEQFIFYRQWRQLKHYANERGIALFGDMPIFVAHDSADVWMQPDYFKLDSSGQPTVVAGVPPDYFSETGQRWGNPLYNWEKMEAEGFEWWLKRLEVLLAQFNLLRIDHFRGFDACWEIPAHEETAINGHWVKVPGDALFEMLHEEFDPLPIVAEDLGIITEEVTALRDKYALPGMKILHFAFSGDADNPYLPHSHVQNSVAYTGTHDNDTTMGWFNSLDETSQNYVMDYLGMPLEAMPWALIRSVYRSVARLAIVPMQDVLELGSDCRMNTPGTTEDNWRWRFEWEQIKGDAADRLRHMAHSYQR